MKVAIFYVKNLYACHYALFGYKETLEEMGHQVLECALPSNLIPEDLPQLFRSGQIKVPTPDELLSCDIILSTYHEYVQPWLERLYSLEDTWSPIMAQVPVIARFDESMDRGDLRLPERMPRLLKWASMCSFPAAQDAAKFGGKWHPFGADTNYFMPFPTIEKKLDIGFIGSLYRSRSEYLTKLGQFIGSDNNGFYVGRALVEDVEGIHEKDTTLRLAHNYAKIRIFFCLPPMSNLIVEKVFDIMACNTLVMYPRLIGAGEQNLTIFEDGKHIVYYDLGHFAANGKQIKNLLADPAMVDRIARTGGEYVREKYTLRKLVQQMLDMKEGFVKA
jgi:hypothetical protein